jgi:glycosyltransferase involved in cell wall biosynthesis
LKNADIILAVSKFTEGEVLARTKHRKVIVIYNGINTDKFVPGSDKKNLVITVASGTKNVIKLKGIEAFARAAEHIPDAKFLVLGLSDNDREILQVKYPSPNLELCGYISQRDLIKCYQKARVYCQLSYRESFGVALAEAMACGCVPVVTERAALPEVVGNTGIYVPYDDEEATAKAIEEALRSDKGEKARERVESRFSGKKREIELLKAIKMIAK